VGKAVTTTTTDLDPTYLPDRYDRLRSGAEIIASDPNVENADSFMNGDCLCAFIDDLADKRVLDGLTEHDADTVCLLATLDFLRGPQHMAWRIKSWLGDDRGVSREDDDTWAVCAVLAEVLRLYLCAFTGDEFMEARTNQTAGTGSPESASE
jgi:hypothetical protein